MSQGQHTGWGCHRDSKRVRLSYCQYTGGVVTESVHEWDCHRDSKRGVVVTERITSGVIKVSETVTVSPVCAGMCRVAVLTL